MRPLPPYESGRARGAQGPEARFFCRAPCNGFVLDLGLVPLGQDLNLLTPQLARSLLGAMRGSHRVEHVRVRAG